MANPVQEQRQRYAEAFQAALEQLDAAQRSAVERIEGPVAVIAGPGAGKTHILAARIGCILAQTDAQPYNILCLTFTDAGVNALRARLLQFIGPEAHRVHIFTFHSFCNSVIQNNIELFGRRDLEPVSDLERIEMARAILDELSPDHPLRQGHSYPHLYEQHLRELFRLMKSEDWTPEYVSKAIDAYLAELPQRSEFLYRRAGKGFQKGEVKQALLQTTTERMERLRAAALLYPAYETAMQQARRYDYDDMILWVLRAFERNENLLRNYQEQYLYFMVDEYQDTNGAQNEVLQILIRYWDEPNVFIVGDDDQSVYEFQGARLQNLTDFLESYSESMELIVLPNNYRSSQHILDAATAVIGNNHLRAVHQFAGLGIEKQLIAKSREFAVSPLLPEIIAYPNRLHECADIVRQIETWRDAGLPLSDIAILYARHKQVEPLQALLERRGIPYQTKRKINILHLPLIQNLMDLLRYLAVESELPGSGEHLLFRLLHVDFIGVLPADLTRLGLYLAGLEKSPAWRAALSDSALQENAGLEKPEAFHNIARVLDDLLHSLVNYSLPAFLERVLNRSGLLRQAMEAPDSVWQLQVLRTFFEFAEQETMRRPLLRLARLLEVLDSFEANRVPLEINRSIHPGEGVQLLTAHSAKGLEFRQVFIIDAVKEEWEPRSRSGGGRFALPDTLTRSAEEDALEARRRLFYVAMTRAQERLQVSYSRESNVGKPLEAAVFVDEITAGAGVVAAERHLAQDEASAALHTLLLEKPGPVVSAVDREVVAELLQGFALSISALNRYLRCPLEFYYQHILRAPAPMNERAVYGMAMHHAVQKFFERMLADREKAFPDLASFLHFFEQEMQRLKSRFAPDRFAQFLRTGRSRIEALYRQEDWRRHKNVRVEYTVRHAQADGIPLTGTIDKIEFHDQLDVSVTDYKTGKPDPKKLSPPTDKNPQGSPWWRQLAFYKILYESFDNSSRIVRSGAVTFLDSDAAGHFHTHRVTFTPEDMVIMKSLLRETYDKIMQQEFYEGCGKSDCLWCNFLLRNVAVDSFAEEEIEALDDAR